MHIACVDDSMMMAKNNETLKREIKRLQRQNLKLTGEGGLDDFSDMHIDKLDDKTCHLHQQHQPNHPKFQVLILKFMSQMEEVKELS